MTTADARTAPPRDPLASAAAPSARHCVVSVSVRSDARRQPIARVDVSATVAVPRARVRLEAPAFAPASLTPPLAGTLFAAIAPADRGTAWEWWVALAPGSPFVVEAVLAGRVVACELTLRLFAGDEELLSFTPALSSTERLPA